jgi:hypothetical protein
VLISVPGEIDIPIGSIFGMGALVLLDTAPLLGGAPVVAPRSPPAARLAPRNGYLVGPEESASCWNLGVSGLYQIL